MFLPLRLGSAIVESRLYLIESKLPKPEKGQEDEQGNDGASEQDYTAANDPHKVRMLRIKSRRYLLPEAAKEWIGRCCGYYGKSYRL